MVSSEARYRLLHEARNNPAIQSECITACMGDILFWFSHFAYTFDPRTTPSDLPFNLMPFQERTVRVIASCIENASRASRDDLLIEKSRDMGISWLIALIFQYYWQFFPGFNFMVGSRKQEDVDAKGDLSSFIEKIRYNVRLQPRWMCPRMGKHEDNHLKLINPVTKNTITGESSTAGFARGKRYRAICIDEMAFHPFSKAAYETAWQSTYCMILPSTPNGKANEYFKIRSNENLEWIDIESDSAALEST